jgi:hypothetical protein
MKDSKATETDLSSKDVDKIDAMDNYKESKREKQYILFVTAIADINKATDPKPSSNFTKNDILRFISLILEDILNQKELWRNIDFRSYIFEQITFGNFKQTKNGNLWKEMLCSLKYYSLTDDRIDTFCMFIELSNRKVEISSHTCRSFLILLQETKHSIGKIFDSSPAISFNLAESCRILFKY